MRYSLLSVALLLAASSASPLSGVVGKRQTLDARDSRENCGKTLDGSAAGGNGIWCPVDQYLERVTEFCEAKAGTTVSYNGQISQTYGITLTNEYDSSVPGDAGHLVFNIYNTKANPTYKVDKDDCVSYMSKQSNTDSKCYGKKHKDTEGGYWKVDSMGLFGSEVYKGAP